MSPQHPSRSNQYLRGPNPTPTLLARAPARNAVLILIAPYSAYSSQHHAHMPMLDLKDAAEVLEAQIAVTRTSILRANPHSLVKSQPLTVLHNRVRHAGQA